MIVRIASIRRIALPTVDCVVYPSSASDRQSVQQKIGGNISVQYDLSTCTIPLALLKNFTILLPMRQNEKYRREFLKTAFSILSSSAFFKEADLQVAPEVKHILNAKLFGQVNVEDFGAAGNGIADDTAAWQNAINYVKRHKLKLRAMSPSYLIGTLTLDGFGYEIVTDNNTFIQKSGIPGDHPVFNITGDDILIGDLSIRGNIATDTDEFCHGIQVLSGKNIKIGVVTGTDIRGDVVYIYGRSTSAAEISRNIQIEGVVGSNILRCLFAASGGQGEVGFVRATGGVGYKDVDLEPNAEGLYQPNNWHIGHVHGSRVQVVSADVAVQNENASFSTLDLSGNRIINSTPAYSGHSGSNDFALAIDDVRTFHCDTLKIKNFDGVAVKLGRKADNISFGTVDFSAVGTAETTYKSVILHLGTDPVGTLSIGLLVGILHDNSRYILRSDTEMLKVDIRRIEVTGGLFGVRVTGNVGSMALDAGNPIGGILFSSCSDMTIGHSVITNTTSAYGFYDCNNLILKDWTVTFGGGVDFSSLSTNIVAINSTINGSTADSINLIVDGNIRADRPSILGA
ncbi:hypothetical protein [Parasphingorhabdus cellanae]|uniref:Pectate lyase superfamily protein domain-containing protein n=1 Tax=Parasphingorhabdus cellanae TaxID=2806553 RepID=A0ABX7T3M1_9SPHN|nr:hypothetical protein [Parasphingorhabdus cellanae]QTD54855.1 hypothetical protein J4G78_11405 [Parasphingorhabdus cellanae]